MANVLLWVGIALIVIGWLALGWQASKRLAVKDELDKFPQRKNVMRLHRNYCWLIIGAGMAVVLLAMLI